MKTLMVARPTGQPQPLVSTLNDLTGTIVANAAIVPAGTGGSINVYASNATDLIIDTNGYYGVVRHSECLNSGEGSAIKPESTCGAGSRSEAAASQSFEGAVRTANVGARLRTLARG